MIEVPLGELGSKMSSSLLFPTGQCCNCSSVQDVEVADQDTKVTTYLFGGGSEVSFQLPLPFCADCLVSSTRRPKSIFHRVLIFLVLFGLSAIFVIVLGEFGISSPLVASNFVAVSTSVAVLVSVALFLAQRPKGAQSSYFQPVRITKLKREFVSGDMTGISLRATNSTYRHSLIRENVQGIRAGEIKIT